MIRVLIADDHAVVRRGLRQIVNDDPDFEVVGEACNGEEALEIVASVECDIVVLDITLPDKNGMLVLQEIKLTHPQLPVLILSMHPEDQFALRALKLGASGYLSKETAHDELIHALRKILDGGSYISSELGEALIAESQSPTTRRTPEKLSERELQVLQGIALGKSGREIAEELSLSVKTVATYRLRLQEKLRLKNTNELMRYAVTHGLIDLRGK